MFSCGSEEETGTTQLATTQLGCLNTEAETRGKVYQKEGHHFQIELPDHWHVILDAKDGLSGSDTLAPIKDYDLVGVIEKTSSTFDLDREFAQLVNALKRQGAVEGMESKVYVLGQGETTIAGQPAKWVLTEDAQVTKLLGPHARVEYFFQVEGSDHYYIAHTEAYGSDRMDKLCELKKMVNTFRYVP